MELSSFLVGENRVTTTLQLQLMTPTKQNMLDQTNVSAMNLFPGLEGIAKSIRYGEPLFSES